MVEQLAYYRAVADEYEDHTIDVAGQGELLSAIDSFAQVAMYWSLRVAPGSGPRGFFSPPRP